MSWRERLLAAAFALPILSATVGSQASAPPLVNGLKLDSNAFRDSISIPFWRALAETPCNNVVWKPDYGSSEAFAASLQPLRERLAAAIGAPLPPQPNILNREILFANDRYSIERVVVATRLTGTTSFGFLARPLAMQKSSPVVVLLHGSGMHPQEAFNWRYSSEYRPTERLQNTAFVGAAIELVEAGYAVYIPWLADDALTSYWELRWSAIQRYGATLRPRLNGLGPYHLLVNEVLAGVDFLSTMPNLDFEKLAIIGWGEGAELATLTAAVDNRIKAVVQLSAPLDRKALRASVDGVIRDAQYTHLDCALGDLEMAALIAPRPMLYAYSTKDESVSRFGQFISLSVVAAMRDLYSRIGAQKNLSLHADTSWSRRDIRRVHFWLDSALRFGSRQVPETLVSPTGQTEKRYQSEWIDSTNSQREQYAASLGTCIPSAPRPDFTSVSTFETSVEAFRLTVANKLRLDPAPVKTSFVLLQRIELMKRPGYSLEFVQIRSNRTGIPIRGLLAIPDYRSNGGSPAIVSADGNTVVGTPFGLFGKESRPYLNAYADAQASTGKVVFVPNYPLEFLEIAAMDANARTGGRKTSYSYMIPFMEAAIDFVLSLPEVDSTRVGIWGISYAGTLALYTGAMDTRISSVVYSNPVVTTDILFGHRDSAGLAAWYPEICSTIDAVQAYLIAPRRFVRENGLRDANGYERGPLESIARVRNVYESLGLSSQFEFVQHNGGHETRPQDIRPFLP